MTKHWPEQSLLASHLGEQGRRHLDFHGDAQQSGSACGPARRAPATHLTEMVPQQTARLEKPGKLAAAAATTTTTAAAALLMDHVALPGSSRPDLQGPACGKESAGALASGTGGQGEATSTGAGKKKNYKRYPKPPYSYLAMIAMVIQRSPEKKLTLSEVRTFAFGCYWSGRVIYARRVSNGR